MSKSKFKYRVNNWSEYDVSLKQRGSLIFWLFPEVIEQCLLDSLLNFATKYKNRVDKKEILPKVSWR